MSKSWFSNTICANCALCIRDDKKTSIDWYCCEKQTTVHFYDFPCPEYITVDLSVPYGVEFRLLEFISSS